jgi:PKD repeat protein
MKTRKRTLWIVAALTLVGVSGCFLPPGPKAEFTPMPEFDYPPLEVTFDATASSSPNGSIVSYAWDFGDGETGAGVTATHTYTEKGTYTVTLTVTDSTGKTAMRSRAVEALNRFPEARFTYWPYMVGTDQDMHFDASESYDTDGEIVEYLWSFGDGGTDVGVKVEHRYMSAGASGWQPEVTLTVVDEDGGTGSMIKKVHVVGCDSCG